MNTRLGSFLWFVWFSSWAGIAVARADFGIATVSALWAIAAAFCWATLEGRP